MFNARETATRLIQLGVHKQCSEAASTRLHDSGLRGTQWRHFKNGHVYTITSFSWSGDRDEWCIEYARPNCAIEFNRSFSNSFEYVDGVPRFEEV